MIVVADGPTKGVASAALFSVSSNGVLAYAGGKGERQLTWYDRNGNPLSRVGESSEFGIFRLSEDDKHLVIERQARSSSRATDLYILEMDKIGTGLGRRFTTEAKEVKKAPVFSSDGRSVIYNDDDGKDGTVIRRKMVNGTGATEILYASTAGQNPSGFSSKGPYLIFTLLNPSNDVMALRVESGNQEQPIILAQGFSKNQKHSNDRFGTVSRDGKWLAYDSDESGRFEVYVRPFLLANATQPGNAKTTGGRKVSVDGGTQAIWRGDGTELFYVVPQTGLLMSVSITMIGDELVPGSPETLFRIHANTGSGGVNWFAASSDGLKFLVAEPPEESTALTVLTNWQAVAGKMSVQ
jgi:Tol biopolymer transport system component